MAKNFTLDTKGLEHLMRKSPEAAGRGAKQALDDIKDDWVRASRDIAPIDPIQGGNLRRQINGEVDGAGLKSEVIVTANATNDTGGRHFNYGYYIHEKDAGGKNLRTPGTVKQFLDQSAEENERKWQGWLEDEMKNALKREGW